MKTNLLSMSIMTALVLSTSMVNAGSVTTDGDDLVISTHGGLKIAKKNKSAAFQIGGRLQWDYDKTESKKNDLKTEDFDVRRARIYVKGHNDEWGYKIQFNVAESSGSKGGHAEDLYVNYSGFGQALKVTIGKQPEPFGMERLTSSKDITSLERTALTEFHTPGRAAGLKLSGKGENWTYGVGIFEANGDDENDVEHTALTGRATYSLIHNFNTIFHLGASFTNREAELSSQDVETFGIEAGAAFKSLHIQGEYFDSEMGSQNLDGFYVQTGWVLTGENRPYSGGTFKRIKPSSSKGAWEVVARYEEGDGRYSDIGLNTTEGNQIFDGIQATLGINYYVSTSARLGFSYMEGEAEDASGQRFKGNETRARFQFAF